MWQEARKFIFRGTNMLGVPMSVKFIVKTNSTSCAGEVKLYDETNNTTIAHCTGINNTSWQIVSTQLSNLPLEEAIFSIRGQAALGKFFDIAELIIEF